MHHFHRNRISSVVSVQLCTPEQKLKEISLFEPEEEEWKAPFRPGPIVNN
jgi:hypothetical protein